MIHQNRFFAILGIVLLLLTVPLIAMQFTDEVAWSVSDFVVMGLMLMVTGLLCELIWRKIAATRFKVAMILLVLTSFLLVWAELAVGWFGSPFAGN